MVKEMHARALQNEKELKEHMSEMQVRLLFSVKCNHDLTVFQRVNEELRTNQARVQQEMADKFESLKVVFYLNDSTRLKC